MARPGLNPAKVPPNGTACMSRRCRSGWTPAIFGLTVLTRYSGGKFPKTHSTRVGVVAQELSTAMQDYLKVVCTASEWNTEPITTTALATRLNVAPSSVSEMIRRLAALGLVHHRPYEAIQLTEEGRRMGLAMMRRHRLIETFLVEELGYTWDEVHDEAEVLEHAISDKMLDRIDAKLGHPTRDPHGDPIPDAQGVVAMPDAVPLGSLDAGESGQIARTSDADPNLLRHLDELGLRLDDEVRVREKSPFTGGTTITRLSAVPVEDLVLGEMALAAIWVVRAAA